MTAEAGPAPHPAALAFRNGIRNQVLFVLVIAAAAAASISGFIAVAPNRLVSGRPIALWQAAGGGATVAIVGPHGEARAEALWRMALASYRPGKIVMRIESGGGAATVPAAARAMFDSSAAKGVPLAFVCAGTACATPVGTPAKLAQVIRRFGVKGADQTKIANDKPESARLPM